MEPLNTGLQAANFACDRLESAFELGVRIIPRLGLVDAAELQHHGAVLDGRAIDVAPEAPKVQVEDLEMAVPAAVTQRDVVQKRRDLHKATRHVAASGAAGGLTSIPSPWLVIGTEFQVLPPSGR